MTITTIRELSAIAGFAALTIGLSCAWYPAGFVVGGLLLMGFAVAGHLRQRPPVRQAIVVAEQPDGSLIFKSWPPDPAPVEFTEQTPDKE